MRRALELAKKARFNCPPNPAVGCVISQRPPHHRRRFYSKDRRAHAEVMALRDAAPPRRKRRGRNGLRNARAVFHYGRTALRPGLKTLRLPGVVAALKDPNPLVAGKGPQDAEEAGVKVECGLEAEEAEEINRGFLKASKRRHASGFVPRWL